ncbi:hypothetical protein AB1Y20_018097 [Prymnesium parvum]|uniref:Leucine zipper transcription factor-like protein 1 n=1 Tax=Prymnesium parvum TaxID=97485 RepID=A0AB34JQK2_PRYPA|mmetsp:Transcript_154/g.389  ORF Transcript_154/g.389 Transcript_154/m.389 type:complete len:315 (+) Transcript_154:44-988(+)
MSEHVLRPEHNEALVEYIRFQRRKRDTCVAEVAAEFKELKESRLFEDSYTREDVEALIDGLLAVVRGTMKRDMQTSMNSSVLLLKQVLEQAEKAGISIVTDYAATEDRALLDAVAAWESSIGAGTVAPQLKARAALGGARASAPLAVIGHATDPQLVAEVQELRSENASLADRFQKLQVQCTSILTEKTELKAQVESMSRGGEEVVMLNEQVLRLQEELAQAREAAASQQTAEAPTSGVEALLEELRVSQQMVAELSSKLDDANSELLAKLEKSKPFLNLRSMLNKKNVIVRDLRELLKANGIEAANDVVATEE